MTTGAAAVSPSAGVAGRLAVVRERLAAAGGAGIRIVAVTKGFGPEVAAAARDAGLDDLGENYAQELVAKAAAVRGVRWHFLGVPQRNKIARLAPIVSLWQAVDGEAVLTRIAAASPGAGVLVQVDAVGSTGKAGCPPGEVASLVRRGRDLGLDVRGLMCVGPAGDRAGTRRAFMLVAGLGRDLGLPELSMGMSGDFEVAAEAGSTMVRLGTVLFGPRPGRTAVRR